MVNRTHHHQFQQRSSLINQPFVSESHTSNPRAKLQIMSGKLISGLMSNARKQMHGISVASAKVDLPISVTRELYVLEHCTAAWQEGVEP